MQRIVAVYPEPNGPSSVIGGSYYFPSRSAQNVYSLTTRLDHRFTENHNVAARYAYNYFIFHDRIFGNLFGNARVNPLFQQDFFQWTGDLIENIPFPAVQISSPVVQKEAGIYPVLLDPKLKMPYSQNWNIGVQHEVAEDVLVDLNYIGSKGTHLWRVVEWQCPKSGDCGPVACSENQHCGTRRGQPMVWIFFSIPPAMSQESTGVQFPRILLVACIPILRSRLHKPKSNS